MMIIILSKCKTSGKSGNLLEKEWGDLNAGQSVFRVENFHPKLSVKVKFSLSKEWNIVIKNPLLLLLKCFSTQKHIVLRLTPTKSWNPLFYI